MVRLFLLLILVSCASKSNVRKDIYEEYQDILYFDK